MLRNWIQLVLNISWYELFDSSKAGELLCTDKQNTRRAYDRLDNSPGAKHTFG